MEDTNFKHIIKKLLQNYQNKKLQRSYIEADSIRGLHSLDVCVCEIGAAIMRQRWMFQKEEKGLCFDFILASLDLLTKCAAVFTFTMTERDRWAVMEKEIDISLRESSVTRGEGSPEGHYLGERWRTRLFSKSRPSSSWAQYSTFKSVAPLVNVISGVIAKRTA